MPGERRDHQELWLVEHPRLLEMHEAAERVERRGLLLDRDLLAAHGYPVDAKGRAVMIEPGARPQVQRRRRAAQERQIADDRPRLVDDAARGVGNEPQGRE